MINEQGKLFISGSIFSFSCFEDLAIHMTHKGFHLVKVAKVTGG
jgi:hypothetical protein